MKPQNPEELSNSELIQHYEEACIYRFEEREVGQVTKWLVEYKQSLSEEIIKRMKDSS